MQDKRQVLIDTALTLFYRHGIRAVGINQVLAESGVAKKTLYHHFNSKDELILATLDVRHHNFMHWLSGAVQGQEPEEKIAALFDALALWFRGEVQALGAYRGCFFINSQGEFDASHTEILRHCAAHKAEVEAFIATLLTPELTIKAPLIALLVEGAIVKATYGEGQRIAANGKQAALGLLQQA
ncbi:TetR/AcrR family transcriptional regulator [Pseudoalteromonas sp. T1lg22]|uniref:TetR/AcrR family transcriptional regulator n=1 Tax=Pseudoalteromonas sp. T1lg22 TaxID=2077096 RepID=UPI000CF6E1CC|nr:TetR/AcrR family transcriptional regulator [Pseudoalteromonas sp. T1lg22]